MLKELTPEMKAAIPAHVAKWIANGRRTDEVNWTEFEKVVLDMYRLAGVPAPKEILRARNPALAASVGHEKALALDGTGGRQLMTTAGSLGGCARFEFLIEVCGDTPSDEDARRWEVQKRFHQFGYGIYFHSKFAIMVDRPSLLKTAKLDGVDVLHCSDGPALAWGRDADGNYSADDPDHFAVYYTEGERVPAPGQSKNQIPWENLLYHYYLRSPDWMGESLLRTDRLQASIERVMLMGKG